MKTRAAVAFEAKRPLEVLELELDGPRAGEVLIGVLAAGICHIDICTLGDTNKGFGLMRAGENIRSVAAF
ncbi:MAG: hypothetical protein RL490_2575 [Pseudomonadota bacterium]